MDILNLSPADKMKHMGLHVAKYVGYALEALEDNEADRLERSLTDCFIVCLAAANAINFDLGQQLVESLGYDHQDLIRVGMDLGKRMQRKDTDGMWIVREMTRYSGRLAKACESVDHMESFPFREAMGDNLVALLKVILAEAAGRRIDLVGTSMTRHAGVEKRNILKEFVAGARASQWPTPPGGKRLDDTDPRR
jgi:hypothetical protein